MHPLFIGGCGRSGTTLLVDLIGCHSQISPIYEPWFIYDVAKLIFIDRDVPAQVRLGRIREEVRSWMSDLDALPHDKKVTERYRHGPYHIRFSPTAARHLTENLCTRLAVEPALGPFHDYVTELFAEHAKVEGKPYWASKVPRYVLMAPLLKQAFPDLRFIHCVRDPRAVVASMASRQWAPKTSAERLAYWTINVERGKRFVDQFPDQAVEVRYEDLVANPAHTLSRLFRWLGVTDESAGLVATYRRDFAIAPAPAAAPGEPMAVDASVRALIARYGYA
jgi:hypothetical protein